MQESWWIATQRLVFTVITIGALVVVVGDAVIALWNDGRHVLSILAGVGFPITFVVWPWTHEAWGIPLWVLFAAGVVSFNIIKAYDRSMARA